MKRQRGTGSIFLRKESDVWSYQIFINGKRERGSTGCRTKRGAESYVRKKLADYAAELSSPETAKVTVKDLVDDVLVRNRNNGNKSVSDGESRWRNHLRPFFGHLRVAQVAQVRSNTKQDCT
jgi:hypothetical protein